MYKEKFTNHSSIHYHPNSQPEIPNIHNPYLMILLCYTHKHTHTHTDIYINIHTEGQTWCYSCFFFFLLILSKLDYTI